MNVSQIVCKIVQVQIPRSVQPGEWYPFRFEARVVSGNNFTGVLAIKNGGPHSITIKVGSRQWNVGRGETWQMPVPIGNGPGEIFWVQGKIRFNGPGDYPLEFITGWK